MSDAVDWREGARAEYRSKRVELVKRVESQRKAEQRASERRAASERALEDLDAGARAFNLLDVSEMPGAEVQAGAKTAPDDGQGSVKHIVLRALAKQHPRPLRAKELRAIIEAELGREVHYKTPGMTLYRLAENRLVQRTGLDWRITDEGLAGLPAEMDTSEEGSASVAGDASDAVSAAMTHEDVFADLDASDEADDTDSVPLDFEDEDPYAEDYLRERGRIM